MFPEEKKIVEIFAIFYAFLHNFIQKYKI